MQLFLHYILFGENNLKNSGISHEALVYYGEQQKEHIQERAYCVSEITKKYLHKNIISPLLC